MITKSDPLSDRLVSDLGLLKFNLLTSGLTIAKSAEERLNDFKMPIRTRSGASGGLDVILPHNVHVNAPLRETFALHSQFIIEFQNEEFYLSQGGEIISEVKLQPFPKYYSEFTSDGTKEMKKIGQMCSGDRFCYGMTGPSCYFWSKDRRCKFCSIGNNGKEDENKKKLEHLFETLEKAINDPYLPAKHILIGGGTPPGDDMGAIMAAELCSKIKKKYSISIYVMIAAPQKNEYIDMLFDSGADELGMNLEFWDDLSWGKYIPGKNDIIGKKRYLAALDHSVKIFGAINTRSILICGLENPTHSIDGAVELAKMGVMPILSPFRALDGTILEGIAGFTGPEYFDIYSQIQEKITSSKLNIPLGPTCICCQNNVLALPFGDHYKFY